jgi:hypothetical protein
MPAIGWWADIPVGDEVLRGRVSLVGDIFDLTERGVVVAAFGGSATRNSRPEEITQVFQVPAFGSI